jgi:Protein of unknown function (DUF1566)
MEQGGQGKRIFQREGFMKFRYACLLLFVLLLCPGAAILQAAEQPVSTPYTKLDAEGRELAPAAEQWAMVRDNATGLIWEVKTTDGSIHDKDKVFDWKGAHEVFLAELNLMKFGGFGDWRLPTTDELRALTVKGAEPFINQEFFPNTAPTSYLSWRKCGSGEIFDERVKFGEMRNTKKDRRVRAVRSGTMQE